MLDTATASRPVLAVGRTLTRDLAAAVLAHHRTEAAAELARILAFLARRGIAPKDAKVWTPELMVGYYGRGPRAPEAGVVCLASVGYDGPLSAPSWIGVYLWWDLGIVSANTDT